MSMEYDDRKCEKIRLPMCRDMEYNITYMPNQFGHNSQEEAALEANSFWGLVELKCSPDIKFLICSMYTPVCIKNYTEHVPACRSVCIRVRTACFPIISKLGFSWPEQFACENLPLLGESNKPCMDPKELKNAAPTDAPILNVRNISKELKCKPGENKKNCLSNNENSNQNCTCHCRSPLVSLTSSSSVKKGQNLSSPNVFKNLIDSETTKFMTQKLDAIGIKNCALPCRGAFLTNKEKNFSTIWLTLWSSLSAVSTFATVFSFLVDNQRFKYPERPVIFLSACYFLVSLGYLIKSFAGETACDNNGLQGSSVCITVFIMIYFFGMASSVWWVVLAFTWFLAASLKWGSEAIASISHFFHLAAWIIPTVQTVWVHSSIGIAEDPITGVCTVPAEGVLKFIVAPLLMHFLLGAIFLFAGLASLSSIHSVIKRQPGSEADKLQKLMNRIEVFSIFYTSSACIILLCYLYESVYWNDWLRSLACSPCKPQVRPFYFVLMLKYFMIFAIGITCGFWIWSGKTIDSWKKFWKRLFGHVHERCRNLIEISSTQKCIKQSEMVR